MSNGTTVEVERWIDGCGEQFLDVVTFRNRTYSPEYAFIARYIQQSTKSINGWWCFAYYLQGFNVKVFIKLTSFNIILISQTMTLYLYFIIISLYFGLFGFVGFCNIIFTYSHPFPWNNHSPPYGNTDLSKIE